MTKISDEDLIENIREAVAEGDLLVSWNLADQAADRIEQLVAINEELVKELHTSRMASVIMDNTVAEAEAKNSEESFGAEVRAALHDLSARSEMLFA